MGQDLSVLRARVLAVVAAVGAGSVGHLAQADTDTGDTDDTDAPPPWCVAWTDADGPCPDAERVAFEPPDTDPECTQELVGIGAYDAADGLCCYQVAQDCWGEPIGCGCQTGRPLVVRGRLVRGDLTAEAAWIDPRAPRPRIDGLTPAERRTLMLHWAEIGLSEHSSIAALLSLALDLLAAGAPPDLVLAAQRAAADEARHAKLAFALASVYAGGPVGPGPLRMPDELPVRRTPAAIARASAREGCVGETMSACVLDAMRDGATDPAVREVLTRIARDEARHVDLTWKIAAWAVMAGGPEAARAFRVGIDEGLAAFGQPVGAPGLRAHGRLDPREVEALLDRAACEVVRPCAAALVA